MFTNQDIMELRKKTGAGVADCKKALTETNGGGILISIPENKSFRVWPCLFWESKTWDFTWDVNFQPLTLIGY